MAQPHSGMVIDSTLLYFLILAVLTAGVMVLISLQRTLQSGLNEIIRGLEEIARSQRRRGDDER